MIKEKNKTLPLVAAFDFDGTITYRDTTLSFLFFLKGYCKTLFYLLNEAPALAGYCLGVFSRQEAKETIFKRFFGGASLEEINRLGADFAKEVLPSCIRPEALERIKWHQNQQHRCVLISASLENYLKPWAEAIGFNDVLSSRLAVDSNGKVSGKLLGLNCRNGEKARRLEELLGSLDKYQIYAYGNSDGDKELLAIADHPFYQTMQ